MQQIAVLFPAINKMDPIPYKREPVWIRTRVNTLRKTGSDPNGSVPELVRIGLAFTRVLVDPNQFGSAIRTSLGAVMKVQQFGSHPKKVSCKHLGSDGNWY